MAVASGASVDATASMGGMFASGTRSRSFRRRSPIPPVSCRCATRFGEKAHAVAFGRTASAWTRTPRGASLALDASEDDGILELFAAAEATRRGSSDPDSPDGPRGPITVGGDGICLGLTASWSLTFDASSDGMGFRDEISLDTGETTEGTVPPMLFQSGYDPEADVAWETELGSGTCRATTFDGAHRSLLVSWIRSGQWLNGQAARRRLLLKLIRGPRVPLRALVEEHTMVPKLSMSASFAEPEPGGSGGRRRGKDRGKGGRKGGRNKFGDAVSRASVREVKRAGAPPPIPSGDGALVAVACRGGSVGARVWLHRDANVGGDDGWVPHRCELATPEGVEAWVFGEWSRSDVGLLVPGVSHQTHPAGNSCVYRTKRAARASSSNKIFSQPYEGYPTDDDRWPVPTYSLDDTEAAAAVPAARGEGGHVLVAPRLNGQASPGWFVLDTSCAGFAIEPSVADRLGMPAFGELSVVGVSAAALSGAMRRGTTISAGCVNVPAPVYMEQSLAAALRTPPPPVGSDPSAGGGLVGVLGTDFLQHCVVELRAPRRVPGSPTAPSFDVFCFNPAEYEPSDRTSAAWQRVEWIQGVPHVRVKLTVADDGLTGLEPSLEQTLPRGGPHAGTGAGPESPSNIHGSGWEGRLFRLSLGAGGAGAIVSARAAKEWKMVERTVGLQPGGVMSGPGEERSRLARVEPEVVTGRLRRVEFAGGSFDTVRALTHTSGDPPDLALSPHADGALCADLFRGCTLVLDFGRNRIAVLTQQVD